MSAIDVASESTLTLAEAAAVVPGRPSVQTVWRWCLRGVRGVVLESFVCGHIRMTSHEAIERFIAAQTARAKQPSLGPHNTPRPTSRQRQRQIDAAEKVLAAHGI